MINTSLRGKMDAAINDNRTILQSFRERRTRARAEELAHQIDRNRFMRAWVQIGQK